MATNKNTKTTANKQNAKKANNKKRNIIIAVICIVAIAIILGIVFRGGSKELPAGNYYADIVIKDYGTITVSLDEETAPETVKNFVNLAKDGVYDGVTFHRIMEGFMMQGGDPNGNGLSDDGIDSIVGEFSANGYENNISHVRGTISMARSNDFNSASSQFFIVHEDSTFLDGQYAGFGYVTEGMEIVDQICEESEPIDNNGTIPAEKQPVIETITIREAE